MLLDVLVCIFAYIMVGAVILGIFLRLENSKRCKAFFEYTGLDVCTGSDETLAGYAVLFVIAWPLILWTAVVVFPFAYIKFKVSTSWGKK